MSRHSVLDRADGRSEAPRAIADSIGFGGVFLYMGFTVCPHKRTIVRDLTLTDVARFSMTTASELRSRQDLPRREFSRRVLDHSSTPPGADSRILQFRQDRRRYRRSRNARCERKVALSRSARGRTLGRGDSQPEAVKLRLALAQQDDAASCARCPDRVPDGCDKAALRELGRGDPLLPLFGDAGRAVHARRPWREHVDLGCLRCALRRPANQQSSSGLRQGLSRPQSRLSSTRCACSGRGFRRGGLESDGHRRRCCNACIRSPREPKCCSTTADRSAPK